MPRPDLLQPPTRRAGSVPRVGAAQQMRAFSLSDLHMERRHLSPSPTLAPTRHVPTGCQLSQLSQQPPAQPPGWAPAARGCWCNSDREQSRGKAGLRCWFGTGAYRVALRRDSSSHRQGDSLFSLSLLSDLCFHLESSRESNSQQVGERRRGEEEQERCSPLKVRAASRDQLWSFCLPSTWLGVWEDTSALKKNSNRMHPSLITT